MGLIGWCSLAWRGEVLFGRRHALQLIQMINLMLTPSHQRILLIIKTSVLRWGPYGVVIHRPLTKEGVIFLFLFFFRGMGPGPVL